VNDAAPRMAEPDAGPGPMLRAAREARGLSEQQVAEQLNLDATLVAALEQDDLASLGAPVFAKGHLRRYGALLGLPEEELFAAYDHARGRPEAPSLVPRSRLEMQPARSRPRWPWIVGSALAFVVAALLAAYVAEYGLRWPFAAVEAPAQSTSQPAPVVPREAGEDVAAPEAAEAVTRTAAADAPETPVAASPSPAAMPLPPGHVSVTLTFAADSWAEVYDGSGQAVLYDLGKAGSQRTIAAAAPLSVTIGNAAAVSVAVNGQSVSPPALPAGQTVARFSIAADGTLR
jgi:cytoskeleton protein RodZ